jgi:hypothetical protein
MRGLECKARKITAATRHQTAVCKDEKKARTRRHRSPIIVIRESEMPTTFAEKSTLGLTPLDSESCKEMPTGLKSVGISAFWAWAFPEMPTGFAALINANFRRTEGRQAGWPDDAGSKSGCEK